MGKREATGIKEQAEALGVLFVLEVFIDKTCSQNPAGIKTVQKKTRDSNGKVAIH